MLIFWISLNVFLSGVVCRLALNWFYKTLRHHKNLLFFSSFVYLLTKRLHNKWITNHSLFSWSVNQKKCYSSWIMNSKTTFWMWNGEDSFFCKNFISITFWNFIDTIFKLKKNFYINYFSWILNLSENIHFELKIYFF